MLKRKFYNFALLVTFMLYFSVSAAEDNSIIRLWPAVAPGTVSDKAETAVRGKGNVLRLSNVSVPEIKAFQVEQSKVPVPAVLILPGGGYNILAYDLEGTEVAKWFNSLGISAFILKYRVPQNRAGALMDAQRAVSILRSQAISLNIQPDLIGVMGFSAGGHLAARLSNNYQNRSYSSIDAVDNVSCKPDFTMLIYPAYLNNKDGSLKSEFPVDNQTPPAFILQTQDDPLTVKGALAYYSALLNNKIPAELHLFVKGGHGYGLRKGNNPVREFWPILAAKWLSSNILPKR